MTSRQRAALIAWAKSKAIPVYSCAAAGLSPGHLLEGATGPQLAALVEILAEAADPGKLREIVARKDRCQSPAEREAQLRKAHSEATALRRAGREVPLRLRVLDSEYRCNLWRARKAAGRESRAA